jgi:hypothetical protein
MGEVVMSYFEFILQRPLDNLPTLGFILVGFIATVRQVLKLFSTQQNLQVGNQAIITQDNSLQSKLIEFLGALQKWAVDSRESDSKHREQDLQFRKEMLAVMKEVLARIDNTTIRIDGTTLATSADVKAIAAKLDRFDKGFGHVFNLLKKKGVI